MQLLPPSATRRHVASFLLAVLALVTLAPRAEALTAASLAAANLPGKTLRFNITGGNAPFETAGQFTIVFGQNATYTIPVADGNATLRSGTYAVSIDAFGTVIRLNGYLLNNATVEVVIIPTNDDLRSQFEMYTTGANKRGTVVFETATSGGGNVAQYAGTYSGKIGSNVNGTINDALTDYTVAINNTGGVTADIGAQPASLTGTINASGVITFTSGFGISLYNLTTATVASGILSSDYNAVLGTSGARYRFLPSGSTGGGTGAPTITTQPAPQSVALGGSVTFTVAATGTGLTYQWLFNGNAIAGATNLAYTIAQLLATHAGSYSVRITTATGAATTSNAATLTVTPAATAVTYLSNLSVRARAGSGDATLIVGVTVGGGTSGTKSVLIRGIGPTLATFGVGSPLADPVLAVLQGSTTISSNDDWNNDTTIAAASTAVGAFALPAGSRDSALVGTGVTTGGYTVQLTGKAGATGNGLVELYDTTPAANVTASSPRFTNLSARTFGGTGAETLIVGFNLGGTAAKRLVLRAVGPGLTAFGVGGTMPDPKLELYSGNTKLAENDNWEAASLATQQSVGAFNLTASSRDAVLISAPLAPGGYTVQVTGGTTGIVLVEVYELP